MKKVLLAAHNKAKRTKKYKNSRKYPRSARKN